MRAAMRRTHRQTVRIALPRPLCPDGGDGTESMRIGLELPVLAHVVLAVHPRLGAPRMAELCVRACSWRVRACSVRVRAWVRSGVSVRVRRCASVPVRERALAWRGCTGRKQNPRPEPDRMSHKNDWPKTSTRASAQESVKSLESEVGEMGNAKEREMGWGEGV